MSEDLPLSEPGGQPTRGLRASDVINHLRSLPIRDLGPKATPKQKTMILGLLRKHSINQQTKDTLTAELDTMSIGKASRTIDYLKTMPLDMPGWGKKR